MATVLCEECRDSIGDKLCIFCEKVLCYNCKIDHLSVGNFPGHIFHNVSGQTVLNYRNQKQKRTKVNTNKTLIKKGKITTMSDTGIENLPHNYGNVDSSSVDGPVDGNQKEKNSPRENESDHHSHSHNVTEENSTTAHDTSEYVNGDTEQKKIDVDSGETEKEVNEGQNRVLKSASSDKSKTESRNFLPNINGNEQEKRRIFELTQNEIEKNAKTRSRGQEMSVALKNERAYSILEVTDTCKTHEDPFIFICDRCDIPVCRICVVRDHKGHKLSDIEETASMRENALASVLTPRIAGVEKSVGEMERHLTNFEADINEVNMTIKMHGEKIKELVDKQVSVMLVHVKEKADKKKDMYLHLNESLHEAAEKGKSLQKRHHDLSQSRSDGAVILKLKRLAMDTKNFHYPSVPKFQSLKYDPPKVTIGDVEPLFGSLHFIDMNARLSTTRLPRIIPDPNWLSSPRHRWQCCRCGTEQVNDTIRIYTNNLFFDCTKCRRSMYHLYRGKVYDQYGSLDQF